MRSMAVLVTRFTNTKDARDGVITGQDWFIVCGVLLDRIFRPDAGILNRDRYASPGIAFVM